MRWVRLMAVAGVVAAIAVLTAGCSSPEDGDARSVSTTVLSDGQTAPATGSMAEGRFIQPVEMELGADAPEWCASVVADPAVRSLPSLAKVATEPEAAAEIEVVVSDAAEVLESGFGDVPPSVEAAASKLASALRSFDPGSPSPESLDDLGQAMTTFGEEVDICDLS